jgi:TetR/AcrR family transcriptional repressor of nem operon
MPRPKSFDPDTVLAEAMGVFWEKGYDAASISDLTAAMGINRFSLYDTFGDKHTLYLKALDSYHQRIIEPLLEKINALNTLAELESYFFMIIEYQHSCQHSKCCMLHMAATSLVGADEAAKEKIDCVRTEIHQAFRRVLERIQLDGDLSSTLDLDNAAWLLKVAQAGLVSYSASPIPEQHAKAAFKLLISSFKS